MPRSIAELCSLLSVVADYPRTPTFDAVLLRETIAQLEVFGGLGEPPARRDGTWIRTFTGRRMYPLNPYPEDVCIEDIAHHLSMECRYNGGVIWHYSVAQHSVLVSQVVPEPLAMQGLVHDAAEAYLKDVPRPLKHSPAFAAYRAIEERMHEVICEALHLPNAQPPAIKAADRAVLAAERRVLQTWSEEEKRTQSPNEQVEPSQVDIWEMSPRVAEQTFLARWQELGGGSERRPF